MGKTAEKLSLYGDELRFAARAPVRVGQRAALIASTLAFHYRNWRKAPVDSEPRLELDLTFGGYPFSVTLRPRDGDIAILYEIFARECYAVPNSVLSPGEVKTIVDAGANIGFSALYFAARYPAAKIFCIEPNPMNFALLKSNTSKEPRIVAIQACVTAEPGQSVYISTEGRGSHFQMTADKRGVAVKGISIEEVCAAHAIDSIDLLKMDIEGAEREVFAMPEFLPRVRAIIAELHGAYGIDAFNADIAREGLHASISETARDPSIVLARRGATKP